MSEWNTTDKPIFAVGDIHGHVDRLEALLKQEGLIGPCTACYGRGQFILDEDGHATEECIFCDGFGIARIDEGKNHVVLIGDVGHFGVHGAGADLMAYQVADLWADTILWGNHDRAVVQGEHAFSGYMEPRPETKHIMNMLRHERKLKLAFAAHGFLFTHAGLHLHWRSQPTRLNFDHNDPVEIAAWMNVNDEFWFNDDTDFYDDNLNGVRDAVGRHRGGRADAGGILWRDVNEKLYTWTPEHPERFRQVFGHSADGKKHRVRYVGENLHTRKFDPENNINASYCIDIGGKGDNPGDNCLAGIWIHGEGEPYTERVDL